MAREGPAAHPANVGRGRANAMHLAPQDICVNHCETFSCSLNRVTQIGLPSSVSVAFNLCKEDGRWVRVWFFGHL